MNRDALPTAHTPNGLAREQDLEEHVDKLFVEAETLKAQIEARHTDVGDFATVEVKNRTEFKKMRSNIKQISR